MKTQPQILLEEIAPDFVQFLKEGEKIDLSSFFLNANPELKIYEFEKILRIHFLLTETDQKGNVGVINFTKKLPDRMHRIKTTVRSKEEQFDGEVRGKIQWNKTLQRRYQGSQSGSILFICDQIERNYDIPENKILKKIISIIYDIIQNDMDELLKYEYNWLNVWIKDQRLKEVISSLFVKNVYLKRISHEQGVITDAMITRALKSRSPLYREAASLLKRYNRLMDFELDADEANKILASTFIQPAKETPEVLFELYWIIKIIKAFKHFSDDFHYLPITTGESCIAEWSVKDRKYRIYHDTIANYHFFESLGDNREAIKDLDSYFGRELCVMEELRKLVDNYSDSIWGGRPDIILECLNNSNELQFILIGEVKYTDKRDYALKGLKELLEYIALIKKDARYIELNTNLFDQLTIIKGCIFVDKIENLSIQENDDIKMIKYGDNDKLMNFVMELCISAN